MRGEIARVGADRRKRCRLGDGGGKGRKEGIGGREGSGGNYKLGTKNDILKSL